MDISIIILNYKSKGLVKQCISNILQFRPKHSFEIIVVDNGSEDGIEALLSEQFPEVVFVDAKANIGYAAGNNLGLKQSKGNVCLVMNPDVFIKEESIDRLYDYLMSHEEVGMVGPQLLYPDGSVQSSCYRFPTYMIPVYRRTVLGKLKKGKESVAHYLMSDFEKHVPRKVDWLLGASLMVKRDAIEKVGYMDEQFFLYYDDVDWSRRFWEAGYEVHYVPEAQMIHFHQRMSDSGSIFKSLRSKVTRIHIQSALKYFQKYKDKPLPHYDI